MEKPILKLGNKEYKMKEPKAKLWRKIVKNIKTIEEGKLMDDESIDATFEIFSLVFDVDVEKIEEEMELSEINPLLTQIMEYIGYVMSGGENLKKVKEKD